MATVTIHDAKMQLSKLIARVEAGEDIIIARGKEPVAKLIGLAKAKRKLVLAHWLGSLTRSFSILYPKRN